MISAICPTRSRRAASSGTSARTVKGWSAATRVATTSPARAACPGGTSHWSSTHSHGLGNGDGAAVGAAQPRGRIAGPQQAAGAGLDRAGRRCATSR